MVVGIGNIIRTHDIFIQAIPKISINKITATSYAIKTFLSAKVWITFKSQVV